LKQQVTDERAAAYERVSALFETHAELNDTLTKHLIVDSRGQHKDRRNERRQLPEKTQVETVEAIELEEYEIIEQDVRSMY
jgi:hypothetical protein